MNPGIFFYTLTIVLCALGGVARAEQDESSLEDLMRQMQQMRQRMESLEKQHKADEHRIDELEEKLKTLESPALTIPEGGQRRVESEPVKQPAPVAAAPSPEAPAVNLFGLPAAPLGQGNLFNPQITAFFDMGGSLSTNGDNEQFNRFNLREVELDIRAAIAPFADGVLIAAFAEEIEALPDGTEIDTKVEVEEGYINFHTLPFDLTLKGGKFRNAFGQSNRLHTHDMPQITRPLAVQSFFGPEGLKTIGGSVSWLVPNPWDAYIEVTGEVVNSDGGEETPILGGPDAENPAVVTHLKLFQDVGETGSFEIGGSYLFGRTADDADFDANVFGLDLTYKWLDPEAPDSRSLLLQSEFFWAQNDVDDEDIGPFRNESFGFYAFGQYQFEQNWYTGVRFDYTEFPISEFRGPGDEDWAVSPYITLYLTEFLRLRLEYQHREFRIGGDWDDEDNLLFGITFSIGSHPTHPYWINR